VFRPPQIILQSGLQIGLQSVPQIGPQSGSRIGLQSVPPPAPRHAKEQLG